jgi:ketosteroid isomerase-like protein
VSIETRKQIAARLIESIGDGRIDENPFTDDFAAWTSSSGNIPGAEYLRRAKLVKNCTKQGRLPIKVVGLTAEGERVAVQATSDAELTDGKHYHNDYHFLVLFKGNKVSFLCEYMNTKVALEMLLPLIRAMS